jgi:Cys-tRNA(Pro)/Cys-tRNA(Cys) deacylase
MMAKKKKKEPRLNSMRVLEAEGKSFEVFTFPLDHHSAMEVAELAGVAPEQVYKTLVVQRDRGKPLLVMIAADRQLNLKRLATAVGEKKLQMASHNDAEQLTRLKVGGISALALLNRGFDVYVDQRAVEQSHIYVSAGQRGVNLVVTVDDLLQVTGARLVEAAD